MTAISYDDAKRVIGEYPGGTRLLSAEVGRSSSWLYRLLQGRVDPKLSTMRRLIGLLESHHPERDVDWWAFFDAVLVGLEPVTFEDLRAS